MSDDAIRPGEPLTIRVDGRELPATRGQTVAGALLANGIRVLRHTRRMGRPRGVFCGMGACYDCIVHVNGAPGLRACLTPVEPGMDVRLPKQFGPDPQP